MKFISWQKVWYDKTISCPLFDVLSLWDERVPELRPIFLKANDQRAIFRPKHGNFSFAWYHNHNVSFHCVTLRLCNEICFWATLDSVFKHSNRWNRCSLRYPGGNGQIRFSCNSRNRETDIETVNESGHFHCDTANRPYSRAMHVRTVIKCDLGLWKIMSRWSVEYPATSSFDGCLNAK